MRTELCDQLGIEFPIFAFSHCRDVVTAVSRAGGFGVRGSRLSARPTRDRAEVDRRAHRRQAVRRRHRHPRQVRGHGRDRPQEARGAAACFHPGAAPQICRQGPRRPRRAEAARGRENDRAARLDGSDGNSADRGGAQTRQGEADRQRLGDASGRRDRRDSWGGRLVVALCGSVKARPRPQSGGGSTSSSLRGTRAAATPVRSAASCCGPR